MDASLLPKHGFFYKYMDPQGGLSFLESGYHWYRCPLNFKDEFDSQADLLANVDFQRVKLHALSKLKSVLCDKKSVRFLPADRSLPRLIALCLQCLCSQGKAISPIEVEVAFGKALDEGIATIPHSRQMMIDQIRQSLELTRVLCVCEAGDSDRMWDEYAANRSGVCLAFRYVPAIDNALGAARKVRYVNEWPPVANADEWSDYLLGLRDIPFGERGLDGLFLKKTTYAHEKEWRVLNVASANPLLNSGGVRKVPVDSQELVSVTLGQHMSDKDRYRIRALVTTKWPSTTILDQ